MFEKQEKVDFLDKVIIKRTNRKKTISISIRNETVTLLSPKLISKNYLYNILLKKKKWITKKLNEQKKRPKSSKNKFVKGESFFKFGKKKTLIFRKSSLEEVIEKINFVGKDDMIVAIKSTIPPGTTNRLNKKCKNISVIFNPEFLTEANFIDDFKNQNRIIIGGSKTATTKLRQVYSLVFPNVPIIKTGSKTAEMVKYFTNTFLATKVSFANEMKMICDELKIDYDKVVEYSTYDERLGKSHWAVPGPDGHLGFGGSCFPKDINALISMSDNLGLWLHTLKGAWHTNCDVRPEEDWKELKGRAVTIDE